MYKKIKIFFTRNLLWKVFSIIMAAFLWFIVMNINNPTEIKTFSLKVVFLNEETLNENNIVVLNIEELKQTKAEIKIRATRPILDEINKRINNGEINLAIDLAQLSSYKVGDEPLAVPVSLKPNLPAISYANNNFEILSFSPITDTVYLDNIVTMPKKIHVKTIGKIKDGYISSEPETSAEYIQVSGAKTIIDNIQVIYAEIDISNQSTNIKQSVKPIAYDKNGNEITGIKYNMETISVEIPINLQGSIEIEKPTLIGKLKEGYIIKSITYEPKFVNVIGEPEDIEKLNRITLPDIDITGISETSSFSFNIKEALDLYNLKLKDSTNTIITVVVQVEQAITKTVTIPKSNINILGINENTEIKIPNDISIIIGGKENALQNFKLENINANIDIGGLGAGKHKVKVNLNIPEGITLVEEPNIEVEIIQMVKAENTTVATTKEETITETTTTETITKKTTETTTKKTTETTTKKTTETTSSLQEIPQETTSKNN